MKEYCAAEQVERIAKNEVIPKWHPDLTDVRIAYLFDEEIGTTRGKKVLAKVRKATPAETFLAEIDAVMIVDSTVWTGLTVAKRVALVDHELCHLRKEETDDGDERLAIRGHDLEEFAEIVKRHGLWSEDLVWFRDETAQMNLFGVAGDVTPEAEVGAQDRIH